MGEAPPALTCRTVGHVTSGYATCHLGLLSQHCEQVFTKVPMFPERARGEGQRGEEAGLLFAGVTGCPRLGFGLGQRGPCSRRGSSGWCLGPHAWEGSGLGCGSTRPSVGFAGEGPGLYLLFRKVGAQACSLLHSQRGPSQGAAAGTLSAWQRTLHPTRCRLLTTALGPGIHGSVPQGFPWLCPGGRPGCQEGSTPNRQPCLADVSGRLGYPCPSPSPHVRACV